MSRTQDQVSQSKISDDESSDLEDEVYRIAEATNEDGTVDVKIKNVDKNESKVTVTFQTPWLDEKEETMAWPKSDDSKYKIVRICENTIGSFTGLTQIEGAETRADPESWNIKAEQKDSINLSKYKPQAFKSLVSVTFLASILGIIGVIGLALAYPFGIAILSVGQGVSVLVASIIVFIISIASYDSLN